MKMEVENSVSFNTLQGSSQKFSIGESGQAFLLKALSKTVYANPIGTIIREYVSNAYDANKEQKNDEDPVLLKLTDDANGTFLSVTDYGPGLSLERIENVFCKYGESTKRDTNDQIGGFGIGAKSAFSYTDMFFINTVSEGVLYKYVLHSTSEGLSMQNISAEPTDLKSGTEIKIYIKNSRDKDIFRQEIFNQLRYFDGVYFDKNDIFNDFQLHEFETFKYSTQNSSANKFNQLHICLGKVAYPINFDVINEPVIQLPFALKFEIGELEVTLSREEVQYSERVKQIIKTRIAEFKNELKAKYESQDFVFTNLGEYFTAVENNPCLKVSDDITISLKDTKTVVKKKCIFKPFEALNIKIDEANPYFYLESDSKINDKFNIVKLSHYDRGRTFHPLQDLFFNKRGSNYIILDEKPSIQKNKYIRQVYGSVNVIYMKPKSYGTYKHELKLPRAGNTGSVNNVSRIALYKKFLNYELFKNVKRYSEIQIDPIWLKNEAEAKRLHLLSLKTKREKAAQDVFEVSNLRQAHGKWFIVDKLSKEKPLLNTHKFVLYCEKNEAHKYAQVVKEIAEGNVLSFRTEESIGCYAARNQKDLTYFQNNDRCIHFEDFLKKLPSKAKQRLGKEAMRNKVAALPFDKKLVEALIEKHPSRYSVLNSVIGKYVERPSALDRKMLEVSGLRAVNFVSEIFYKQLRQLVKILKHAPFLVEFEESSLRFPKPHNKVLLRKIGFIPGNNAYQTIEKWEDELLQEANNKVKYLQSLTK